MCSVFFLKNVGFSQIGYIAISPLRRVTNFFISAGTANKKLQNLKLSIFIKIGCKFKAHRCFEVTFMNRIYVSTNFKILVKFDYATNYKIILTENA